MDKRKGNPKNNLKKNIKTELEDTDYTDAMETTDATSCIADHGIERVVNMRRFDKQIKFLVECKVCNKIYWQPANIVKRDFPQKLIDFYESCIKWQTPMNA